MQTSLERRRYRSSNVVEALRCLLETQRIRGALETITLATDDGCLVAGGGTSTDCEELAAWSPLVARGVSLPLAPENAENVTVHAFLVGEVELVLAMRGSAPRELLGSLALAAMQGSTRILRGNIPVIGEC